VLLCVGDDVSTDEIMPAGARVLPYRSNVPAMSTYAFEPIDNTYSARAQTTDDHFIVAGSNYGQGSSREHAAIVPRFLGLRAVLAKSFARIHRQNLLNFAILPLTFIDPSDRERINRGDVLVIDDVIDQLHRATTVMVANETSGDTYRLGHDLRSHDLNILCHGSLLDTLR
jgi:aconitate hydratase